MIEIVRYQPDWPQEFARLGGALRRELGGLALRIDHVGSTAVPGLAAKDVIDIQITARRFDPALESALQGGGYIRRPHFHDHIPPGAQDRPEDWSKWVFREKEGQRRANLHIRLEGRPNQRYPLLFRDYLRAHPSAAEAYARVKVALARLHPEDSEAYYDVKDPVCDIIIVAAEAWAHSIQWQAGPTDC